MREGPPDDIPADGVRGRIELWNDEDDEQVVMRVGGLTKRFTPDEAREHADDLADHIEGTQYAGEEETEALIADLRERADVVEAGDGD